ncbi:helix-turn-helix domain-containing protein [Kribbella sp.]|nr:helix-turn-helix domain-containing protein [Kribbella sp.]HZX05190.1 helix-turn-helix domain-containing protein [Kribbella sp.]
MQQALIRLAVGESVTRVAHACGWASTSAFIDTFRRAFGHTPGSRRA